jgi:hypothetical protein
LVERSFAHCYETGGMRRCTLRGHENILKRLLVHVGAFNISLILRKTFGAGTPRELRNRAARLLLRLLEWLTRRYRPDGARESRTTSVLALPGTCRSGEPQSRLIWNSATLTTGCYGQLDILLGDLLHLPSQFADLCAILLIGRRDMQSQQ